MDADLIPCFSLQNELHPQDRYVMKCHLMLYGILRNCKGVPEELQAKFIHHACGKSQVVKTNQKLQDQVLVARTRYEGLKLNAKITYQN